LATIPFALIQGTGRADITGKLHLLELPFYLAGVWYLTIHFGIVGTAVAWLLRVTADCILLFLLADNVMSARHRILWPVCTSIGIGVVTVFALAKIDLNSLEKSLASVVVLLSFTATAWFILLGADERNAVQRLKLRLLSSGPRPKPIGA
jgi:hypothetical protein